MALTGKLETEIEIKSPAEKFFHIWKKQCNHFPTAIPHHFQAVEVHEGDWETAGSIKVWNYTVGGRNETFKERIEVDDQNMSVTLVGLEGDIFKSYKSWKPTIKVTPKGSGSLATLSLEYEKQDEDIPVPEEYLDFMVRITQDIDAHLVKD